MNKIISIYLLAHLALMIVLSRIIWLPAFFLLYGGIQALVLLCFLIPRPLNELSVSRRRFVYAFSLMEVGYTFGLGYVWAYAYCNGFREYIRSSSLLNGSHFTHAELFFVEPGFRLSELYLFLLLMWGLVCGAVHLVKKM